MAEVTVLQLAERLSIPLDRLLQQMKDADLPHEGPGDAINDDQQARLLTHLRGVHGEEKPKSKITLKRRESSTLRAGRSTVNVQVRKKRTIVRRPVEEPEPELVPEPVVEKPLVEEPVVEAKTRETGPATPELEVVAEETPESEEAEPEAPVAEIADEVEAAELPEAEAGEPESEPEAVAEPESEEVVEPELAAAPEPQMAEPEPSAKPKVDLSNIEAIRRAAHAESVAEAERRKEETRRKAAELADKKAAEEAKRQAAVDAAAAKREEEAARERRELEESKVSDRKDRRDRHDLDEGDNSKSKSRSRGSRGRKNEMAHLLDDVDEVPANTGKRTLGLRTGGEGWALHAHIGPAVVDRGTRGGGRLQQVVPKCAAYRVAKSDVGDQAILKEGGLSVLGAVDELVDDHHVTRDDRLLQRADGRDADDPGHAQLLHPEDIRSVVDLRGVELMVSSVPGQEDQLDVVDPVESADSVAVRWCPKRCLHRLLT